MRKLYNKRGYCFKANELMKGLSTNTLKISWQETRDNGFVDRRKLMIKVFTYSVLLVMTDMTLNGTTFYPYKGLESLSFFYVRPSKYGYNHWIFFKIKKHLFFKYYRVMVQKSLYDNITDGLKRKCIYGLTGKVRYPDHYVDGVKELFPYLCVRDIKRILHYGWRLVYKFCMNNRPLALFYTNSLYVYIDLISKTGLKYYIHYTEMMADRIKYEYCKKKVEYSGYYYFALSKNRFDKLKDSKNIKIGKKIKNTSFGTVILFRSLSLCKYQNSTYLYIFKIRSILPLQTYFYISNLITSNAELIEIRKPMKLKDVYISNNKYKLE